MARDWSRNGARHRARIGRLAVGAGALAVVVACSPVVSRHGYVPIEEDLEGIVAGIDTRGSVRRKIGRPGMGGLFNDDGWYYVSTTIERRAFYAPEVVDRQVIVVSFDDVGIVTGVNRFGLEDGRVVDLETRTTPTYGQQLTVLQQLLGNFGAIDSETFDQ